MQEIIKRIETKDYDQILELNRKNEEFLIPMDRESLRFLDREADVFDAVFADDIPVAFIIVLPGGISYDLKAYRWFSDHFPDYLYIDRIVIDEGYRKKGLGRKLYQRVFKYAADNGYRIVAAAISADNEASLQFHKKMGFREAGRQTVRNGTAGVSQQVAETSDLQ